MATSSSYRGGNIWTMVTGSGETLGSGGQLLNNNFTELYDMVHPPYSTDNPIVYVPTMYKESSAYCYARTLNVPDPAYGSLEYSNDYVPVITYYGSGTVNLAWKPYVSTTGSGTTNNSNYSSASDNAESASELYQPGTTSAVYNFYDGSTSSWYNSSSAYTAYQKTYKSVTFGNTLQIKLPDFGAWLVTGTILAYRSNTWNYSETYARLMRVYIAGFDSSIKLRRFEVYNENNESSSWTTTMMGYPTAYMVSGQMKIQLTENYDVGCILHDLTVVGGGTPTVNSTGSIYYMDWS